MISVLTGITTNFVGCLLTRFFLGFIEAAFLPGALLILSRWYTSKELTLRYTLLYVGKSLALSLFVLMRRQLDQQCFR